MGLWNLVRSNSGLDDTHWRRFVVRWSVVSLLLIAVAAYNSYGFFQFDEHYQVVEFTGYKLGKTPESELAWEYRANSPVASAGRVLCRGQGADGRRR